MTRTFKHNEIDADYREQVSRIRRERIRAMHRTSKMQYEIPDVFASVDSDSLQPRELSSMIYSASRDFD